MHAEPPVTALFEAPFTKRQKSLLTIDVARHCIGGTRDRIEAVQET
jgi:hypothetical protein